ncbi:hypothetical protein DPMN_138593 [Dreissena polymorpha]|uniref:EGF-like domain-containing protein n=1 Tax=Dreissena polymorpha TaxID=45954 RepID=A0A9D4G454_DREPO|nr:hypothetical protein DPMN_138593 [Dreissena polymorpha]
MFKLHLLPADINECLQNPCLNKGTCSNTEGSYKCTCPKGWRGANCEYGIKQLH